MHNNIHIALATSDPVVADRLLQSMKETLSTFKITASVLIFGATQSEFNTYSFCVQVDIIDIVNHYPPIYENRNRCQVHLQEKMKHNIGLGFILDDDLIWTMPEHHFISLLNQLQTQSCDIAFSSLTGDTPIPKEYARTSSLLDVLLAIAKNEQPNNEISQFLAGICITKRPNTPHFSHHDYYSYDRSKFQPMPVNINTFNWSDFIQNIAKGKVTTRPVQLIDEINLASGRERGGATLILNPSVLNFKNNAMFSPPYISRRSDMLMATNVRQAGYKMFNTPPMLEHLREDTFDTHDVKKLIGDILGYAMVETATTEQDIPNIFKDRLIARIDKTTFLLSQSTTMLKLLNHWLQTGKYISDVESALLHSIEVENSISSSALSGLDTSQLALDFIYFIDGQDIQSKELKGYSILKESTGATL